MYILFIFLRAIHGGLVSIGGIHFPFTQRAISFVRYVYGSKQSSFTWYIWITDVYKVYVHQYCELKYS